LNLTTASTRPARSAISMRSIWIISQPPRLLDRLPHRLLRISSGCDKITKFDADPITNQRARHRARHPRAVGVGDLISPYPKNSPGLEATLRWRCTPT
jgi:hypothetical protein